jgi:hypothetical protein
LEGQKEIGKRRVGEGILKESEIVTEARMIGINFEDSEEAQE